VHNAGSILAGWLAVSPFTLLHNTADCAQVGTVLFLFFVHAFFAFPSLQKQGRRAQENPLLQSGIRIPYVRVLAIHFFLLFFSIDVVEGL